MNNNILKGVNKLDTKINIGTITGEENEYDSYVIAGNIHKNIRTEIQPLIKPGTGIYNIACNIRKYIRLYTGMKGVNNGIAFPPVLSVSDCIAHYSPTKKTDVILKKDDNIKIDFGVQVNGYIVDSAFTAYFDKKHDEIHKITKEALYEGIKHVGIDAHICDVGNAIQEVIDSYDFKLINGVGGHNIKRYNIHGGMFISNTKNNNNYKFTQGAYAIEPFVTYHTKKYFSGNKSNNYRCKNNESKLYKYFNNLIFTDDDIEYFNINNIFNKEKNKLQKYPPLYVNNDIGVQYEHTVYLDDNKKKVLTLFDDY